MNQNFSTEDKHLYKFRGRKFMSDEKTIKELNYALALNRCSDRYEQVKPKPKNDK